MGRKAKNPAPIPTALVLRTCNADMTSHGGFVWPESGPVIASDWEATDKCGNGLHGLLWGEGDGSLLDWSGEAKWLVVEVFAGDPEVLRVFNGKCKYPSGSVVFCGDRSGATAYIAANGGAGRAIVGGTATAGDSGTATAGYSGTATAGYRGTATAGDRGTATAGYSGTATAGDRGTATAGDSGTATAGYSGTATAGYRGTLIVKWWDGQRDRVSVAYTGETSGTLDIKPNTPYRLNGKGEFVEVAK